SQSGTFTIALAVTDNGGATASASTTATILAVPPVSATTVVMWAANTPAAYMHGNWSRFNDSSAAGQVALRIKDAGAAIVSPALSAPTTYFEQTFTASAGVRYHLWVRMRAENNSTANDSVHIQFNDSITAAGAASLTIGTSGSAAVILQPGPSG